MTFRAARPMHLLRFRLNEVPALAEPLPALDRPTEYAGEFQLKAIHKPKILLVEKGARQLQRHQTRRERARRVSQIRQFIRHNQKAYP